MPWFKVDDALAMHMKAFAAGNQALGLWVRAGSWSMHQLSDGFIPQGVIAALGGGWDDAAALVNAGLWHQAEGGYQFHDWAEYQPTREQVLAEREANRQRVAKHREKRRANGDGNANGNAITNGGSNRTPSRPDPTPTTYVPESSHVGNRARENETDETTDPLARSVLDGLGIDAERLRHHIYSKTGRRVSVTAAMNVATHLHSRGEDVKSPQAYVLGSITRSWAEVQQYIDENGLAA